MERAGGGRLVVLDSGHRCGLHGIEHLMRPGALRVRPILRGFPVRRGVRTAWEIAQNVLDWQFQASGPDQKWVVAFDYPSTAEGWLYVAVMLDCTPGGE